MKGRKLQEKKARLSFRKVEQFCRSQKLKKLERAVGGSSLSDSFFFYTEKESPP